ncbi:hypothetical protein [Sphingomonas sp. ZB1N12]|uniref:hypothetical protein n=1 Tax=Sphingomonas arabinosi TaxID=3096160 RepID=UPI002FC7B53F
MWLLQMMKLRARARNAAIRALPVQGYDMYSITPELRAAHARALVGALRLAEIAPWSFHKWALALSPPFCSYLYVASAELLLVPSVNSGPRDMQIVGRGMRDARSDALIVSPNLDDDGQLALRYSLGIWHRDANAWYGPLLLWMASSGELWLVPDAAANADRTCFRLTSSRFSQGEVPWRDAAERSTGLCRAQALTKEPG